MKFCFLQNKYFTYKAPCRTGVYLLKLNIYAQNQFLIYWITNGSTAPTNFAIFQVKRLWVLWMQNMCSWTHLMTIFAISDFHSYTCTSVQWNIITHHHITSSYICQHAFQFFDSLQSEFFWLLQCVKLGIEVMDDFLQLLCLSLPHLACFLQLWSEPIVNFLLSAQICLNLGDFL